MTKSEYTRLTTAHKLHTALETTDKLKEMLGGLEFGMQFERDLQHNYDCDFYARKIESSLKDRLAALEHELFRANYKKNNGSGRSYRTVRRRAGRR